MLKLTALFTPWNINNKYFSWININFSRGRFEVVWLFFYGGFLSLVTLNKHLKQCEYFEYFFKKIRALFVAQICYPKKFTFEDELFFEKLQPLYYQTYRHGSCTKMKTNNQGVSNFLQKFYPHSFRKKHHWTSILLFPLFFATL